MPQVLQCLDVAGDRLEAAAQNGEAGPLHLLQAPAALRRRCAAGHLEADQRAEAAHRVADGHHPLDAVIADFMAGAVEWLTPDNDEDHWDMIEGQGSLFHVSYSGVTMALIHGGQPDALILAHEPTRTHMRGLPDSPIPSLEALRDQALPLARIANPDCVVAGISVNTKALGDDETFLFRYANAQNPSDPRSVSMEFFKAELERRTAGRIGQSV